MSIHTPIIDDSYRKYIDLLLQHTEFLNVEDRNAEVEAIEDAMTALWDELDATQRRSLSGLGSDLIWAHCGCRPAPRGPRLEDITPENVKALVESRKLEDWHGVLHFLRICSPQFSPFQLAQLRALAWSALDFPELARVFYDLIVQLEPSNGSAAVLALRMADRVDHEKAIERAEAILEVPFRHPVVAVALAIEMMLRGQENGHPVIDQQNALRLLRSNMDRLRLEVLSDLEKKMTYQLAATSFESLEKWPEALHCYEEGLRIAPDTDTLLVGLGLLLYGKDDDRALKAFSRAAEIGTPLVWPYFFLAHHDLVNGDFAEAQSRCYRALERTTSNRVRAELLEWIAISQSHLSLPHASIESLFRKAQELDPLNESIARNLHAFETSRQGASQEPYTIETAEVLKNRNAAETRDSLRLVA